jgi:quercetin dioxygenase-like cupin family protein
MSVLDDGPLGDEEAEELAALAARLTPLAPSPQARGRLLASLAGPDRFRPFFADLARRFDLTVEAIRAVLARIDDPKEWLPGPVPLVHVVHFTAGPALAGADTGLVRIPAGAVFPRHRHLGPELAVVLEGSMYDSGRRYRPGEAAEWPADSVHDYQAGPERDLVLIVSHYGIDLLLADAG